MARKRGSSRMSLTYIGRPLVDIWLNNWLSSMAVLRPTRSSVSMNPLTALTVRRSPSRIHSVPVSKGRIECIWSRREAISSSACKLEATMADILVRACICPVRCSEVWTNLTFSRVSTVWWAREAMSDWSSALKAACLEKLSKIKTPWMRSWSWWAWLICALVTGTKRLERGNRPPVASL